MLKSAWKCLNFITLTNCDRSYWKTGIQASYTSDGKVAPDPCIKTLHSPPFKIRIQVMSKIKLTQVSVLLHILGLSFGHFKEFFLLFI